MEAGSSELCRVGRSMPEQLDKAPDSAVAKRAAGQWGVLSLGELRACGLSADAVLTRVQHGRLHRLHRSVYAVGHPNPPLEGRWLAAVKACGAGAVISHASAAALWGIVEREARPPDVTLRGTGTRLLAGVRVHRAPLGRGDIGRRHGIPVTSPARTLVDLAGVLPPRELRRAVREAQAQRLVTIRHVLAALDRAGPWRGRGTLAAIVAAGPAPTRSELEDVVLDLILRGGLDRPMVNAPLVLAGRRIVPDFRWPEQQLVVEADGSAWHEHRLARANDAERQALLEAHGERVIRITWRQAVAEPEQTLKRLRCAGAPSDPRRRDRARRASHG
jgi:Transcriptional regulator, AbiEi antitoxin/Protein of unknown function (DUF559)